MSTFSENNNENLDSSTPNVCISGDDDEVESLKEVERPEVISAKRKREVTSRTSRKRKPPLPPKVSGGPFESRHNKKKTSKWWAYYEDTSDPDVAMCSYCDALIGCKGSNGTTPLKNHAERCKKMPANIERKQKLLDFEPKTLVKEDGTTEIVNVPKLWEFDQKATRKALARMVVVDELPFIFVEREGFRYFCKFMNPAFVIPSRSTIRRDCYDLYIEERKKLVDFFKSLSSRVCLTTDTWTSGQNLSYMCLTAHFVDENWKLHKRILNFCPIAGHSGELIGRAVEKCLKEWGIKDILTMTVDNASSNDLAIQYLKRRMNHSQTNVLNGDYLHMRCVAHILNLVVKDGLKDLDESIVKVRGGVRYVRSSPARLQKFKACAEEEGLPTKSLVCLDVDTRWNSTYLMLASALKFKKAFTNLHSRDNTCVKELRKCGGKPEENDWKRLDLFLPFLQIFYDATLRMSGSRYVTANSYVIDAFGVGLILSQYCEHEDDGIRNMARQMKLKHDKYWGNPNNLNVLMFIALVLDPRRKLGYVDWVVEKSFGVEQGNLLALKIRVTLRELFETYASSTSTSQSKRQESSSSTSTYNSCNVEVGQESQVMDFDELMTSTFQKERGGKETSARKNELEKYLADDLEPKDPKFDILQWWKDRRMSYPIIQCIARDILAIPVSTVASESAFSTGGRVLDSFRTSLTPKMVEALVCAQDWLRTSHTPLMIEECLVELETMEGDMEDVMVEQPTIVIDESLDFMDA